MSQVLLILGQKNRTLKPINTMNLSGNVRGKTEKFIDDSNSHLVEGGQIIDAQMVERIQVINSHDFDRLTYQGR
jgi:menaquinone-dependent protoporphyrinogen IX oxidase